MRRLGFEVYCDTTFDDEGDLFAVLTNPGPDTPEGALGKVQEKIDNSSVFETMVNGDSVQEAGAVYFDPDTGEIDRIEIYEEHIP